MNRVNISAGQLFLIWVGLLCTCQMAMAIETVTIGENGTLDWQGNGSSSVEPIDPPYRSLLNPNELLVGNAPGDLVEFASPDFPSGIHPLRIQDGENIANSALQRGGSITAPNVFGTGCVPACLDAQDLRFMLEELITLDDGGEKKAFERKYYNALGTLIFIQLGGTFGVNRVRFYPRDTVFPSPTTPFSNDFLRAFELFTNDGSKTEGGNTIWEPLLLEPDNENPVVDIYLDPPRTVTALRLRSTTTVNYEIDEFEVFGIGFLSNAQYISDIFDAGQPAVWSVLRWQEEVAGDSTFSDIQIRTRTGSDTNPFVFTRLLHGQRNPAEVQRSVLDTSAELALAEYKSLPLNDELGRQWNPGPVRDDLINWSPFSTPLPAGAANDPAGAPITSPGPRRYFQIQVIFNSRDLDAGRVLKQLSFDFLSPPLADAIVGEIFPRDVPVSKDTTFTFALRAEATSASLRGFDTVEISTQSQVRTIEEVQIIDANGDLIHERQSFSGIDDTSVEDGIQIAAVSPSSFALRIPPVKEDGTLIKVQFKTSVLTYSTNFTGSVQLSTEQGSLQTIIPGNATELGDGDEADLSGTTVLSSSALDRSQLLDRVTSSPNPFSPNGDGINDELELGYSLLALGVPRPVEIKVYDLSGTLVKEIYSGDDFIGEHVRTWDGTNLSNRPVPPGLYLLRIAVSGDAKAEEQARIIGVAY